MSVFPSLDSLIRDALEESEVADPTAAVDMVMRKVGDHQAHYLREAIRLRLPATMSRARTSVTPPIRHGLSTKAALIRDDYWPRFLNERLATRSGTVFLRDATADDLRSAAAVRQDQAAQLIFRAEQFASLAALMDNYGAQKLSDLDPQVGREVMERAA